MTGHLEGWREGELVVTRKPAFHVKFFQSSQFTETGQHPEAVSVKRVHDALQTFEGLQCWQHGLQMLSGMLASH